MYLSSFSKITEHLISGNNIAWSLMVTWMWYILLYCSFLILSSIVFLILTSIFSCFFVECANVSVPLLMYEDTQACLCQVFEESLKVLERKVKEADAFLLVTDKTGFEIPPSLVTVKHYFKGNNFTWRPYGVQCVLLGGSVHSRKVAMRLRVLLEGSDYPYMTGVLPRRCSWTEMYAVDPSLETPGPCVLWVEIAKRSRTWSQSDCEFPLVLVHCLYISLS